MQAMSVASAEYGGKPEGPHGALATVLQVAWPGLAYWVVVVVLHALPMTRIAWLYASGVLMLCAMSLVIIGPLWAFMVRRKDVSRRAKVTSLVVNFSPAAVMFVQTVALLLEG